MPPRETQHPPPRNRPSLRSTLGKRTSRALDPRQDPQTALVLAPYLVTLTLWGGLWPARKSIFACTPISARRPSKRMGRARLSGGGEAVLTKGVPTKPCNRRDLRPRRHGSANMAGADFAPPSRVKLPEGAEVPARRSRLEADLQPDQPAVREIVIHFQRGRDSALFRKVALRVHLHRPGPSWALTRGRAKLHNGAEDRPRRGRAAF